MLAAALIVILHYTRHKMEKHNLIQQTAMRCFDEFSEESQTATTLDFLGFYPAPSLFD